MALVSELLALSEDSNFRSRVRNAAMTAAVSIYGAEGSKGTARASFAYRIIQDSNVADRLVNFLLTREKLKGSSISYNFETRRVETDASDQYLVDQLMNDWDMLAGS